MVLGIFVVQMVLVGTSTYYAGVLAAMVTSQRDPFESLISKGTSAQSHLKFIKRN